MKTTIFSICSIVFLLSFVSCSQQEPADLILINGEVYTMEEDNPWADTVIIKDNRIVDVLSKGKSYQKFKGQETRIVDLDGRFALPGFIDAHVHFNRAGALINDINLMVVAGDSALQSEIQRVVKLLGPDEWITGGLWGAYEQWALGADRSGDQVSERWKPTRDLIDPYTEKNPCLLSSFDRKLFLANSAALEAAGLSETVAEGMGKGSDGKPNGLIFPGSPGLKKIQSVIKRKSNQRLLNENRAGLKKLAASGIVEVHDIAAPDQTRRFIELQERGELTCRVWLRPDLSRGSKLKADGFTMGLHPGSKLKDGWLRYGALKGYVDGIMGTHGALFFEPYNDQPDNPGHYRRHTSDDPALKEPNMDKLFQFLKVGYEAGFVANVHAIGTKGVSLLLDTIERLKDNLGTNLNGFRVIHAQVIRPMDFPRFQSLNVIAEVNPYHISDDMRWMEERIGTDRCRGAYAFKSLLDNGSILSFGSDWPGTSAAEYLVHPKYLIHAAVNRTTLKGTPEGGWFPEQKISVHEALKAYTINNAYAAFEDHIRGSIKKGKFADITVCDRNLMKINPEDILKMDVLMTIVDGKVVFEKADLF